MILVDTNVLIRIEEVQLPSDQIVLSALSYGELQFGIERTADAVARRRRQSDLVRLTTMFPLGWLPFDRKAAESFGRLASVVAKQRPAHARSTDIMLAGQADALGASFMTFNAKDFELVADQVEIVVPTLR
jgi:predicted nucleic acid-binding protein